MLSKLYLVLLVVVLVLIVVLVIAVVVALERVGRHGVNAHHLLVRVLRKVTTGVRRTTDKNKLSSFSFSIGKKARAINYILV